MGDLTFGAGHVAVSGNIHSCKDYLKPVEVENNIVLPDPIQILYKGKNFVVRKFRCTKCGKLMFTDFETGERVSFDGGLGEEVCFLIKSI